MGTLNLILHFICAAPLYLPVILFGLTLGAGYVGKKVLKEPSGGGGGGGGGGGRSFGKILRKSIGNTMRGGGKKHPTSEPHKSKIA